jgi:hypothetical protein
LLRHRGVASETRVDLEAALRIVELTLEELQELVLRFAVFVGWAIGGQLDHLVLGVGQ